MPNEAPDSPVLGRNWCRVCEPDADPTAEILNTMLCPLHAEAATGQGNHTAQGISPTNNVWCEFFHRGRVLPRAEGEEAYDVLISGGGG